MIKALALGALILLGLFDILLVVSCSELENDRRIDDEAQQQYLKEWREQHGKNLQSKDE